MLIADRRFASCVFCDGIGEETIGDGCTVRRGGPSPRLLAVLSMILVGMKSEIGKKIAGALITFE